MARRDLEIRALVGRDRIYRKTDERSLYLEVHPNGSKLWRFKYRLAGKDKCIAIGRYPDVGLADARQVSDDARRQIQDGLDPVSERKRDKLVAAYRGANSFGDVAREYIDKIVKDGLADATIVKANWILDQLSPIASFPVSELKSLDILSALKRSVVGQLMGLLTNPLRGMGAKRKVWIDKMISSPFQRANSIPLKDPPFCGAGGDQHIFHWG